MNFALLVPFKKNQYEISLDYQSYEKAKPLLEEFNKLELIEEELSKDIEEDEINIEN